MIVALLLFGLSAVYADRCASVPPSLWCSSEKLGKECGFEEICNRYSSATRNEKINITVLFEALCPYCQRWIIRELYPKVFKNFADYINIEFVPFGNAKIKLKEPFKSSAAKCLKSLSVNAEVQGKIQTCMTSPIGDELQLEAAEKTANIWPEKHRWVPWIVVNGVSLESVQSLMYNLPHHLCEWYNGDQEIQFCASDGKAELPGIFGENIINQLTNRE